MSILIGRPCCISVILDLYSFYKNYLFFDYCCHFRPINRISNEKIILTQVHKKIIPVVLDVFNFYQPWHTSIFVTTKIIKNCKKRDLKTIFVKKSLFHFRLVVFLHMHGLHQLLNPFHLQFYIYYILQEQ